MLKLKLIQNEAQTLILTATDASGDGPLTTRTSDTAGTATLEAGHGIETGDVVVVEWDGGLRESVTVGTVSGHLVELTASGSGDNYPVQDTIITVMRTVNVSGATIVLWAKRKLDGGTTYVFQKADTDFTKNYDSKNYKVSVALTEADLDFYGVVFCIVQYEIAAGNTKKDIFMLDLTRSPED